MNKTYLYMGTRIIVVILLIVISIFSIKWLTIYIYPFLIAFVAALLLNPFVTKVEKLFKMPRGLSIFTVMASCFLIVFGIFFILIIEIVEGTSYLAEQLPDHIRTLVSFGRTIFEDHLLPIYEKLLNYFNMLNSSQQETLTTNLESLSENLTNIIINVLQNTLLQIPNILLFIPSSLTLLIFILLGTFFILLDWKRIENTIRKFSPREATSQIRLVSAHLKKAFTGFLKAQLILILITGAILFIGLLILQINHALTISLIAILIDLLPYVGTGLIFIPWILYLFIIGQYKLTIGLTILYMLIVITRQIIEPKILSANIGINPLAMLITLFACIQLWGIIGLMIAPLVLVIINAFIEAGLFHKLFLFIKGTN